MRIRTIKPEFWTSERIAGLSDDTCRLTFIGLWNYVDDAGRGKANPSLVLAALFPLSNRTAADVGLDLAELDDAGLICQWDSPGGRMLHVCGFLDNQRISHPTKSRLPPSPLHEDSVRVLSTVRLVDGGLPHEIEVEVEREEEKEKGPVVASVGAARYARGQVG